MITKHCDYSDARLSQRDLGNHQLLGRPGEQGIAFLAELDSGFHIRFRIHEVLEPRLAIGSAACDGFQLIGDAFDIGLRLLVPCGMMC